MSLKVYFWNCGSGLLRKFDFVKSLIVENGLDALFIAEAEFRSDLNLGCLSINGYDLVFAKTIVSRKKSRIICFKRTEIREFEIGSDFDNIIALNYNNTFLVGIYRPFKCFENESERSNFERFLNSLGELNFKSNTIIVGDFNVDISRNNSRFLPELRDWSDSKGLNIVDVGVSRSRWVADQLQESTIDFMLTNNNKFSLNKEITHLSDHYVIKLEVFTSFPILRIKKYITVRNWNFDLNDACRFLSSQLSTSLTMSLSNINEIDYRI